MTDRFAWLVERLYRANTRMARCQTDAARQRARAWLRLWNRALKCEHARAHHQHGAKESTSCDMRSHRNVDKNSDNGSNPIDA
jgi:hypothetical protein